MTTTFEGKRQMWGFLPPASLTSTPFCSLSQYESYSDFPWPSLHSPTPWVQMLTNCPLNCGRCLLISLPLIYFAVSRFFSSWFLLSPNISHPFPGLCSGLCCTCWIFTPPCTCLSKFYLFFKTQSNHFILHQVFCETPSWKQFLFFLNSHNTWPLSYYI